MDENLKYFKLSGESIEANVVLAIKPDMVEETIRRYGEKGYTLEETECPKDAQIISAEPRINPAPFMLHNYAMMNPWANVKTAVWDGPCCARCANKYNDKSDYCYKHHRDDNCYRFKMER